MDEPSQMEQWGKGGIKGREPAGKLSGWFTIDILLKVNLLYILLFSNCAFCLWRTGLRLFQVEPTKDAKKAGWAMPRGYFCK